MWILVAGFKDPTAHLDAQMRTDAALMKRRIRNSIVSISLGLMVYMMTYGLYACYTSHGDNQETTTKKKDAKTSLLPEEKQEEEQEQQ